MQSGESLGFVTEEFIGYLTINYYYLLKKCSFPRHVYSYGRVTPFFQVLVCLCKVPSYHERRIQVRSYHYDPVIPCVEESEELSASKFKTFSRKQLQGGSNMTGTDCV
jgi:hypothetical protein